MALEKDMKLILHGVELEFQKTYTKIDSISGNKEKLDVIVHTLNKQGGEIIKLSGFYFTPSNELDSLRWDKQAYEYLKKTEEFKDAMDV